jgi:hypothetical protein
VKKIKTWKEMAIETCEWRDLEIEPDDIDELQDVFMDYCNPIKHIEKLQKALDILRESNSFYADDKNWYDGEEPYHCTEISLGDTEPYNFGELKSDYCAGKKARQAEQAVKDIMGEK